MPSFGSPYLQGQYALFKKIEKLSAETKKKVAEAVVATAGKIASRAAGKAPADTGRLRSSIRVKKLGNGMTAQVWALPGYALAVESGYTGYSGRGNRRAGFPARKIGGKWRAVPELEAWAERRGIPPWPLARAVYIKGTKKKPFLFKAMDEERRAFLAIVEKAVIDEAPKAVGGS